MLSITGMTLEQFADLMGGLGYKAEQRRAGEGQAGGRGRGGRGGGGGGAGGNAD